MKREPDPLEAILGPIVDVTTDASEADKHAFLAEIARQVGTHTGPAPSKPLQVHQTSFGAHMPDDDDFITVGDPIPRIVAAAAGTGTFISITWDNGKTELVDLWPTIANHPVFAKIRNDRAHFERLKVSEWGDYIYWPEDPDASIPASSIVRS